MATPIGQHINALETGERHLIVVHLEQRGIEKRSQQINWAALNLDHSGNSADAMQDFVMLLRNG